MRDGHRDVISNLEKEENAIKMWEYLERKYLNRPEKINGSSVKKIVAAKNTNPVKKSKIQSLQKEVVFRKKNNLRIIARFVSILLRNKSAPRPQQQGSAMLLGAWIAW